MSTHGMNTMTRIKVQPVRAANGRIQGWAVNRDNYELAFFLASIPDARRRAMDCGNRIADAGWTNEDFELLSLSQLLSVLK